ncbi:MAG: tyrosine-type recombinase/integrase [Myxococcales bacterium]|nr:tyrosine-type recombinase/integrase [Myxococcales bacterium]
MKTRTRDGIMSSPPADEQARFADFVADLERRGRAPKTIGSYRSDWVGFTEWYASARGAPFGLERLNGDDVTAFRDHLQAQGMRPATVNRKLVFLKRYAAWGRSRGDLAPPRLGAVRGVDAVPQGPREPRGLSDLELRRFLREVERRAGPRDQAIIYTLLETGLRVSELVALQVDDIHLGVKSGALTVEDERTQARCRRLTLGVNGRRKLRRYLNERGEEPGPLFVGERGALTANAVQRLLRKYCGFAKVKASPGTLRHTFANGFLANEGDLVELADLLGHESLETTRLYLSAVRRSAAAAPPPTSERPRVVAGGGERG